MIESAGDSKQVTEAYLAELERTSHELYSYTKLETLADAAPALIAALREAMAENEKQAWLVDNLLQEGKSLREQLAEARAEVDHLTDVTNGYRDTIKDLTEQNAKLREALEFYADREKWWDGDNSSPVDLDYGDRARQALKGDGDAT
jgi:predicted  nucleic acid-binding Zn-ribbon protein